MKFYHHGKTLEKIPGVGDPDDPMTASKSEPGSPEWMEEEANEPEHMKALRHAAKFCKEMSKVKDYTGFHKDMAKAVHHSLEPIHREDEMETENKAKLDDDELVQIDDPKMDFPEPEYEPGEMGEKGITKCPECGGKIESDAQGGQCVKCGWRPTDSKAIKDKDDEETKALTLKFQNQQKSMEDLSSTLEKLSKRLG